MAGEEQSQTSPAPMSPASEPLSGAAPVQPELAGVSPLAFAALSLLAIVTARGLAPALPGSATGIAGWITATAFFAACSSQLVAAGGIALCLRLLGAVFGTPSLGVAFRVAMMPIALSVVVLVLASATRPLEPELSKLVALAAVMAALSAAPFLIASARTRACGLVLLSTGLSGALAIGNYEFERRLTAGSGIALGLGTATTALSILVDLTSALVALIWVAARRRRLLAVLGLVVAGVALLTVFAELGNRPNANGLFVLLHRSIGLLADRPLFTVPESAAEVCTLFTIASAGAVLFVNERRSELRAALCLSLLGRTASFAPAAALLSLAGALLLAVTARDPYTSPSRQRENSAI